MGREETGLYLMDREDMNRVLGLTEAELDAIAEEYETDELDASQLGEVITGHSPADDNYRQRCSRA